MNYYKMRDEKKALLIAHYEKLGWTVDRFGNLISPDKKTRFKFKQRVVRLEYKALTSGQWYRTRSAGYQEIAFTDDGKIKGFKF